MKVHANSLKGKSEEKRLDKMSDKRDDEMKMIR